MRIIPVFFSLFLSVQIIHADVFTCGGFVKTLSNARRSGIRVKLLTMEGNQKYEAECNPDNGYYMIPIYNKGQYKFQIVPPSGWIYEKDTFVINVDGINDECTKGVDINFEHTGFTISGLVKSGNLDGPSGFKLGLYSNDKLVSEVTTDENGRYSFAATPGKYVVYNVDKEAQCIERGKVSVTVVDAPIVVKPDITISGHLLTVNVFDENRHSYPGVEVTLNSKKKLLFENSLNQNNIVETSVSGGYQYLSKADDSGRVEFPCLPPGDYMLTSTYKTKDVELIFAPKSLELSMKSQNTVVEFVAAGFVTAGQVVIGNEPIIGADIILDGVKLTRTDANGKFILKEVKSGEHRLTAEKENFVFDVQNVKLSPLLPNLPLVTVKKINICGVIKVDKKDFANARISINSNIGQYFADIDADGFFCLAVPPAKYSVRTEGLPLVTPEQYNVDVLKTPVLNLLFTQFKANVQVSVQCLGSCGNNYVTLNGADGILAKENAGSNVVFKDVPPGRYNLVINANEQTCWNHENIEFRVEDKDISGLIFRQTGYKVNVLTNYPMKLQYQHFDKAINGLATIEKESQSFCVADSGAYKLTPKSCHEYSPSQVSYTVPSTEPIEFNPKKAQVAIRIDIASTTSEKFTSSLRIKDDSDNVVSESVLSSSGNSFSFSVDMELVGKVVELIPQSEVYLFTPETLSFVFDGNCNENTLVFKVEKGLFIQGTIVPPVLDAAITVINKNNAEIKQKLANVDSNGKFSFGPLSPHFEYEVKIEKEGYKFIKNTGNNFQSIKLSELRVSFVDVETKAPLGQVLVSISGADNYRSNQVVGDSGTHNYIGLPPGEYYIVAVLQEYHFDKVPAKISVKEGQVETLVLEGKRTAWSVFGKVTYLNGRPVSQIRVEALSKKCGNLQEDAVTDQNGQYRIRGLMVDCEYEIAPKLSNDDYSLYPPYIKNLVKREDRRGIDFVITTLKQTFELFGKLNFGENDVQPNTIRASLKYKNNVVQVTDIVSPSRSFIFVNDTVNFGDKFVVLIEDVKTRRIVEIEESVVANGPFARIELSMRMRKKSNDIVVSNNSYFGILLIFVFTMFFLYPEKALPIFNHGVSIFQLVKARVLERNGQFVDGNRRTRRS